MNIGLLIIGDEILSGKRQDKHLPKVIELLQARGLALHWARYAGDERECITAELRHAFASGDLVFSCGGIGATPDDHTRQSAAAALGRALVLHAQARALIEQRMQETAAAEGKVYAPDAPDNLHRLNMGMFPSGASIIPNPYNRIAGFSVNHVHFVPGFPVMAWPMIEWVLDTRYAHLHKALGISEMSLVVQGAMEATLTPLMEKIEHEHPGIKVFSLPSVDHPQWGRHIELGVKGEASRLDAAYTALKSGLDQHGAIVCAEMVR